MSSDDIFAAAEKVAREGAPKKAYWTGVISLNLPELEIANIEYHLKAAKADSELSGDMGIFYQDKTTGRKVEKKSINVCYENGKELTMEEVASRGLAIKFERERYFDSEALKQEVPSWKPIPKENVILVQQGDDGAVEEVAKFQTSKRIDIGRTIALSRLSEFDVESTYMLGADTKKEINESAKRVRDLAELLLKNKVALYVENFVLRTGLTVHDCIIFPYRVDQDDKMWLLMAITQGQLKLDLGWAIEAHDDQPLTQPVVKKVAKVKRK
jgi:hypothetical protein